MRTGWRTRKLGDVLEVRNGYAFNSKGFNPLEGIPLIRIRDLKVGTETETRFTGDYDDKYVVKAGDLLIGMDGEFGCYEWQGSPALLNQRVCKLQCFTSDLVPRFLFYGVNSHLKAIEDVTGYTTVKHLSSKRILDIEFLLPPLPEQQRIVDILNQAFEGINTAKAHAEKNLQNASALFESHLQSVFTQRNDGWVEKKLGSLAGVQSGGTPLVSRKEYWGGHLPWYSSGELNATFTINPKKHITRAGLDSSNAKLFPKGSLLIGMYDTAALKMSILDRDGTFNQAIAGVKPNEGIDLEFILHAINAAKPRLLLERRGVRQKNLSLGKIKDIAIPLPKLSEQRTIVSMLKSLRKETQRLASIYQGKLAALEALKKSLLNQAFTGQLTKMEA